MTNVTSMAMMVLHGEHGPHCEGCDHEGTALWRERGGWYACEHPERPWDEWCDYEVRCRACVIKAQADLAMLGDFMLHQWLGEKPGFMLSEAASGQWLTSGHV